MINACSTLKAFHPQLIYLVNTQQLKTKKKTYKQFCRSNLYPQRGKRIRWLTTAGLWTHKTPRILDRRAANPTRRANTPQRLRENPARLRPAALRRENSTKSEPRRCPLGKIARSVKKRRRGGGGEQAEPEKAPAKERSARI